MAIKPRQVPQTSPFLWEQEMGLGDMTARVGTSMSQRIGQTTLKINELYEFRSTQIYRVTDNHQKDKILYKNKHWGNLEPLCLSWLMLM